MSHLYKLQHDELLREVLLPLADYLQSHPERATPRRRQQLEALRIEANFEVVEQLLAHELNQGYNSDFASEKWWEADAGSETEEADAHSWWTRRDQGIPRGPDGRPRFRTVPP